MCSRRNDRRAQKLIMIFENDAPLLTCLKRERKTLFVEEIFHAKTSKVKVNKDSADRATAGFFLVYFNH